MKYDIGQCAQIYENLEFTRLFSESWLDLRNFETAKTESIETVNRLSRGVTHEFDNVCALDTNDGNLLICSRGVSKGKMASIDL